MLLVLLLSSLAALSSAAPVEEVQCPRLPCPLPPCDHPHPTYYKYHDKLCEGCSQCHVLQTRQLSQVLNMCPMVMCAQPGVCSVPLVQSTFHVRGMECPGCPVCPTNDVTKRQLIHLNICPIVDCMFPGPCSVAYKQTTFNINGKECPGCPVCPAGHSGIQSVTQ